MPSFVPKKVQFSWSANDDLEALNFLSQSDLPAFCNMHKRVRTLLIWFRLCNTSSLVRQLLPVLRKGESRLDGSGADLPGSMG